MAGPSSSVIVSVVVFCAAEGRSRASDVAEGDLDRLVSLE